MTIELRSETLISLAQAARMQSPGRRGRPVSPSTIFRWIHDGVKTSACGIIRLEGCRMGGRWLTSIEALERFASRQTPDLNHLCSVLPRSPTKRQKAAERAGKELEKAGI